MIPRRNSLLLAALSLALLPCARAAGAGAAEMDAAGNLSYDQGELAEAAAGYEKARQAAPEQSVPLYNLGVVLYRQDNLVAALGAFQSIPQAAPGLAARLHYNQGNTLAQLGRLVQEQEPEQALELYLRSLGAFRRVLELESAHRAAAVNLEIVRRWVAELRSRLVQAQAAPGASSQGTPAPGSGDKAADPPQNAPPPAQDPVVEEPAPWELPDESAEAILREESARREEEQSRGGRSANEYPAW